MSALLLALAEHAHAMCPTPKAAAQNRKTAKNLIGTEDLGSTSDLQHVGTVVGFVQESSFHDEAQHLFIGHALVGLLRQRGDLPQHDSKWPATRHE